MKPVNSSVMSSILGFFKKNLMGGLIFTVPILLTIMFVRYCYHTLDEFESSITHYLEGTLLFGWMGHFFLTVLITIILILLIAAIGIFTASTFGRWFHKRFDSYVAMIIPVYKFIKETVVLIFSHDTIYKVVLVEIPTVGGEYIWRVAYLLSDSKEAVENGRMDAIVQIYLGHAPNPSSGNVMMCRLRQIIITDVTPLEVAKNSARLGIGFAQMFASYIEDRDTARTENMHVDIVTERRRFQRGM